MPDTAQATELAGLTLVIGGARSGKSRYAEALMESAGGGTYLATAEAGDEEMAARIAAHKARRGNSWQTIEEPLKVADAIHSLAEAGGTAPVLVDCLTIWLANLMAAGRDPAAETAKLLAAAEAAPFPVVLVTNEVGGGIVPENALARAFRDVAGAMNQQAAAAAGMVYMLTAGIAQRIK